MSLYSIVLADWASLVGVFMLTNFVKLFHFAYLENLFFSFTLWFISYNEICFIFLILFTALRIQYQKKKQKNKIKLKIKKKTVWAHTEFWNRTHAALNNYIVQQFNINTVCFFLLLTPMNPYTDILEITDQQRLTYINSVQTRDAISKTFQLWWTIRKDGKRATDIYIYIYIYIYIERERERERFFPLLYILMTMMMVI